MEGWKSVNTDPTNFSAHRFLTDSYSILSRHEIARVSELLQSQLLQPINITPIQPRLAESNLFLISAGGPGALSFNEFNPIFNRDRVAVQASGLVGENDTWAGEGVVAGIYKKVSFSLGYTHFTTNGFRPNNDQKDDIVNAFIQLELSPNTSVQTEVRHRETKRGEVELRFAPDDFRPNLRERNYITSTRLGARHAFSPSSTLIGNVMYQDAARRVQDASPPTLRLFEIKGEDYAYSGELQYLFRSTYINFVSGVGYFNIDSKDNTLAELLMPGIPLPPPLRPIPPRIVQNRASVDRDTQHTNVYLYSYIHLLKDVILTLGGSGDFFDTDIPRLEDQDQFNPKFGIVWNPLATTTVRGAVFRTLKRTLITDQTLEPTQVAGFNQFFDDPNATRTWRYGVAVDQQFSKNIYGGVEYSLRDLEVPSLVSLTPSDPRALEVDWEEKLFRAYFFWTPHAWLALSTGAEWERFERDARFADNVKTVETYRVPLGINFFHPSGLSALLKATYVDQRGVFQREGATTFERGSDDFWVVDAAISYRLPKRYGFITVGATNVFDEKFKFFDTDRRNPRIIPDRVFFTRLTLAFP